VALLVGANAWNVNLDLVPKRKLSDIHRRVSDELHQTRLDFISRVELAVSLKSPTRRKELYMQWRELLGDDCARESARFAEAVISGEDYLVKFKNNFKGDT
jgi:hypothetical protein